MERSTVLFAYKKLDRDGRGEYNGAMDRTELLILILSCLLLLRLVWEALQAAEALEAEGISAEVLNVATVKPLDEAAIIASLKKTGCAVVAEEHNAFGGLGEAVASVVAAKIPTPLEFVNGEDKFGQSGTPAELMKAWGFDAAHLAAAAKKAIGRK